MVAERLTSADASQVVIDATDQVSVFLLAGLLGPGGFVGADGEADLALLRSAVADRLAEDPALRRFTQRIASEGRRLVWEACPPVFDQHIRLVEAVPGRAGFAALAARLMTTPLPRDRPLWELLIVPGAGPAGPGLVLRVHHAMADGVAAVRLVPRLFGSEAPPAASPPGPRVRRRVAWRGVVTGIRRSAAVLGGRIGTTVLLGRIGPERGVAFVDADLATVARSARAVGGTLNDALLAAVAGALRAGLAAVGEPVPEVLPASVPVALPDRGGSGNATGIMLVELPTGEPDPMTRVARIAGLTRSAKAEARRQGTLELTRTRWTTRLFGLLARRQRFIALFVTNVRGPDERLQVAGAPLERAWPLAQIYGNVRLGIAAFSYAGRLSCAVHLDAGALDADVVGEALRTELERIAETEPGAEA